MLRRLIQPEAAYDKLGFRLRGLEMTRLETFVDAAFAFSVTMLALSPDRVPTTFVDMVDLFRGIPAFLFSLAMLLLFWNSHVVYSRRFGLDDGQTTFLSCLFIAVMLVYVYPLKFMATAFFAYYIPPLRSAEFTESIRDSYDLATMFVVMSGGSVMLHASFVLLHRHAIRKAGELGLTPHEMLVTRCEIGVSLIHVSVGGASIALALLFRQGIWVVSAGFVYVLLGALLPLFWTLRGPSSEDCATAKKPTDTHPA